MAEAKKSGLKRMRSESGVMMKMSSKQQGELYDEWKKKRKMEINSNDVEDDTDYRNMPQMRVNAHLKDELRNPQEIKKIVAKRENLKMKNMEKGKRRKVEANQRKKKNFQGGKSGSGGMKFRR
jgi:hypothetical protein